MNHKLLRIELTDTYTQGVFQPDPGAPRLDTIFTIEQPWADNKPFHSCIPTGTYTLVRHNSEKHPHTFALVNAGLHVVHLPSDIPEGAEGWRYACLIHPANLPTEVEGCIAPGLEQRKGAVGQSRKAFAALMTVLHEGDTLTIEEAE